MDPRQQRRVDIASNGWIVAQLQPNSSGGDPCARWVLRTPKNNDSPASKDTDAILEGMTYVGGMNYAKYRLEACRAKASGRQNTRPPTLYVQDELTHDGTASTTSSRRSYRAVEEAAAARSAMLQAEAEAQRALARLADTRAECNEQHKVMTAELEALQDSVKGSLRSATQQTTVQAAKVDAWAIVWRR